MMSFLLYGYIEVASMSVAGIHVSEGNKSVIHRAKTLSATSFFSPRRHFEDYRAKSDFSHAGEKTDEDKTDARMGVGPMSDDILKIIGQ
jgi:hypothetical protein